MSDSSAQGSSPSCDRSVRCGDVRQERDSSRPVGSADFESGRTTTTVEPSRTERTIPRGIGLSAVAIAGDRKKLNRRVSRGCLFLFPKWSPTHIEIEIEKCLSLLFSLCLSVLLVCLTYITRYEPALSGHRQHPRCIMDRDDLSESHSDSEAEESGPAGFVPSALALRPKHIRAAILADDTVRTEHITKSAVAAFDALAQIFVHSLAQAAEAAAQARSPGDARIEGTDLWPACAALPDKRYDFLIDVLPLPDSVG